MQRQCVTWNKRKHFRVAVKHDCLTAASASAAAATVAAAGDGRFVIQDLSSSVPSYWTSGAEQLQTSVVGSTASSSSSFVDDESTSYEDIAYNGNYGPSSALQAATTAVSCSADYGSLQLHHHLQQQQQQYGNGGYYDGGYQLAGYDDKPPYDNNNAADACDMNTAAAVAYGDPYAQLDRLQQPPVQQVCIRFCCGPRELDTFCGTGALLLQSRTRKL